MRARCRVKHSKWVLRGESEHFCIKPCAWSLKHRSDQLQPAAIWSSGANLNMAGPGVSSWSEDLRCWSQWEFVVHNFSHFDITLYSAVTLKKSLLHSLYCINTDFYEYIERHYHLWFEFKSCLASYSAIKILTFPEPLHILSGYSHELQSILLRLCSKQQLKVVHVSEEEATSIFKKNILYK